MLPQWALNLGPQPFEFDTLLSESLRRVAWDIPKLPFVSAPLEHVRIQILDLPSNTCLKGSERRVSDPIDWLMLTGVISCCWIFCLHTVKPVMPTNITIIANFG